MTVLSKATPRTTTTLLRSQLLKPCQRNASFKFTSNNPLKAPKSTNIPPAWSPRLFELPKPRPIAKQRYESAAGVMETSALMVGIAVIGTLYGRVDEEEKVEGEFVESQEDRDVHDWIRPFDCYVVEEKIDSAEVVDEVDHHDVEQPLANVEMGVKLLEINRGSRSS